jgi:hypothetical protein
MKFLLSVLHRTDGAADSARRIDEFERLDDAIAAAKQVVDGLLDRAYVAGMTSAQLLAQYRELGETPYIVRDDEETINAGSFNHFKYAKTCSERICAGTA